MSKMPKPSKIHYKPDDVPYYEIYPRRLFCGGWMLKPKTTNSYNGITCKRCIAIIEKWVGITDGLYNKK